MEEIKEQEKLHKNARYIIDVDNKQENDISNIKVYKRCGLSTKDFCHMIFELHGAELSSVKNLDGVVIIDTMLDSGSEFNIQNGSDIEIRITNKLGRKVKKVIKDCHVVGRCIDIYGGVPLERVIIVSGDICSFKE